MERLEKVTQRSNSMCAGSENEGVCKDQRSRMGARVIGPVPSKRNHCLLEVCLSRISASLSWGSIAARRAAGSYTLTRAQARTMYWTPEGKPLKLDPLLPHQVGQTKERMSFG